MCKSLRADQIGWLFCFALPRASISGIDALIEVMLMARDFAKSFYNSKEWEQTRDFILRRDNFLCVKCGRPAEEVHHIKHLSPSNIGDVNITMNPENLVSLCRECHFNEHKGEHGRGRMVRESNPYTFDANGMLIPKA